jgi:hypothetical protein
VRLRNQKERTERKQKTKEAETSKVRDEKKTRLVSAWTLLREFSEGLLGMLLRESEG